MKQKEIKENLELLVPEAQHTKARTNLAGFMMENSDMGIKEAKELSSRALEDEKGIIKSIMEAMKSPEEVEDLEVAVEGGEKATEGSGNKEELENKQEKDSEDPKEDIQS